ncbi:MAG: leucine--tRNA ligase [Candidatus Nanohalobium sp.]
MAQEFAERLKQIEQKWQKKWEEASLHKAEKNEDKEKKYILDMFPYPSGRMHMGHGRAFSLSDVYARFKSMQGYNVMHPMGWDAFGMPAENAAIDRDIDPGKWTFDCIDDMRDEFKRLGFSLDWDREITTCEPEYYRWDQWIFLKMLEEDIAYRDEAEVNWCPSCETVLADEQVEDGLCWRCDSVVDQNKKMEQWKLAITDYADELVDDLEKLDGWPDKVREMQENWIDRSTGARINFSTELGELEVFTTRPDTIFGATYMALAPEHEMAEEIAEENEEVATYIEEAKQKSEEERKEKSKEGVFTGKHAENPFTGDEIPIYVAEFVLEDAGTGAIMAVPAHDQRDFEFAQEHDIDVQTVVQPEEKHSFEEDGAWEGDGEHINSKFLNGLDKEEAIEKIVEKIEEKGIGEEDTTYKLRDWLISRQRYWGTPIPIVYCDDCGAVPVPEEDLPVELPDDVEFTGRGNPVETSDSFIETECPECGGPAERETDTMDTFINSSWYFLRYCSPDFKEAPFDEERTDYWMNVDQYVGGIEHATMHLIYARFFQKFLRDQGMVEDDEPFEKLLTQGMVNHPAYKCPDHGWIYPEEVEDENICSKCGKEVEVETIKMSKSKNNVVRPSELVEEYGADTARLFILSASHPSKELDWSKDGVQASYEMLERVERLVTENDELLTSEKPTLEDATLQDRIVSSRIQRAVENTTEKIENYEFNLAVSEIDKLLTKLYWYRQRNPEPEIFTHGVKTLVKLIAPFAPHLADELWNELEEGFLYESEWPEVDEELLDEEAEKIDEYFSRVAGDIREIQDMLDSKPEKVKVISAADWKYDAFQEIEENLELDDIGAITGKVIGAGFKDHADTVNQKVQDAYQNPGKFRNQLMERKIEKEALKANRERWKEEFNLEVEIEPEEDSSEDKADRAEPGKPAIVME